MLLLYAEEANGAQYRIEVIRRWSHPLHGCSLYIMVDHAVGRGGSGAESDEKSGGGGNQSKRAKWLENDFFCGGWGMIRWRVVSAPVTTLHLIIPLPPEKVILLSLVSLALIVASAVSAALLIGIRSRATPSHGVIIGSWCYVALVTSLSF